MPTAHNGLRTALSYLLLCSLLTAGTSVTGCDSGGSSGNATGADTVRVTNSLDGNLTVKSTPSNHTVNWIVSEYDGDKVGTLSFPGETPVDIPNVDEIKIGDDVNPPGFDRFEVIVQSSSPGEDLDSVTLLNGGQEVTTAKNPVNDNPDTLTRKYVIIVTSP